MRWKKKKALFTGDHVMGWSTTVIAPPDGNMGDYMRSLEKLLARDDVILYPTHGAPIPDPEPFVHAYLLHRRIARGTNCQRALARSADTISAIVARLYPGITLLALISGSGADGAGASGTSDRSRKGGAGRAEVYRLAAPLSRYAF